MAETIIVELGTKHFQEANAAVRADASINRVGAWATGTRAMEKSLLYALLQPGERLKELQDTYQFTEKMMLAEQAKSMPFGAVWDEYCRRAGCPLDGELYPAVAAYEAKVLPERM